MKNTSLTTIHVLGIGSFLFLVSSGITAQAIMAGMLILIVWATAAMVAIESRPTILEMEPIGRRTRTPAGHVVPMPVEVQTAA